MTYNYEIHDLQVKASDLERRLRQLEFDVQAERERRKELERWVRDLQTAMAEAS